MRILPPSRKGEGDEIEDEEQDVDQDAEVEEEDEGEDAGKSLRAHAQVAHGEQGGDADGVDGAGDGVANEDEEDESDNGGEELGGGAGEGGEHLVAGGVAEVARGEGDGLAPAEHQRAAEDEEDGPDEHAEEIEVAGGVHAEAAHHARGGIAETVGGPGLRAVVQGDRETMTTSSKMIKATFNGMKIVYGTIFFFLGVVGGVDFVASIIAAAWVDPVHRKFTQCRRTRRDNESGDSVGCLRFSLLRGAAGYSAVGMEPVVVTPAVMTEL